MIKKAAAVMAVVTMLVAGPVMNHVTAEAYSLDISKTLATSNVSKVKSNNSTTGQITINSGVLPGSLHVSARLVRRNDNGGIINCMNAVIFTSNGTQTGQYINGGGVRGEKYYLAARIVDSSRFDSATINYNFQP